jgi:hypothetical protein
MKRIIEKINELYNKYRLLINKSIVVFFILISFFVVFPKLSIITEIFSKNTVFYFPVKYITRLNQILDRILREQNSYTITANGFLKVDNPEIAKQMKINFIIEGLIPSKLYPFFSIDKERDRAIRDTLEKVAKKFEAEEDVNGDGKTNCVDAAIWFYLMYPYRKEVMLTCNYDLKHAFNTVVIGNTLRCIEPQAFVKTKENSYFLEDCWGSQYHSKYNEDVSFILEYYLDYLMKTIKEE